MIGFTAQLALNGIISGALYALLACAMAVMCRLSGAYNFALGHLVVLGSYLFITIQTLISPGLLFCTLVLLCLAPILAALTRAIMIIPFEKHGSLSVMIVTLVCASAIEAGLVLVFGPDFQRPAEVGFWSNSVSLGAQLSLLELALIVSSALSIFAAHYYLKYSRLGRALTALCDHKLAASAIGIRSAAVEVVAYSIAFVWIMLVAVFAAYQMNTQTELGFIFTLKALAVLTCVGIGDFRVILAASVLLGILENLFVIGSDFVPISYKDSLAVAVMTVALIVRHPANLKVRQA